MGILPERMQAKMRPSPGPVLWVFLALVSFGCSAQSDKARGRVLLPAITFAESRVIPIASNESIRGAVFLGEKVLYWTPSATILLEASGLRKQVRCPGPLIGLIGAGQNENRILALDTIAHAVLEIDQNGSCRVLQPVELRNLIAGTPTSAGWLLIVKELGKPRLFFWSGAGRKSEKVLPESLGDSLSAEWLFLHSSEGEAFLGNYRAASSWQLLDSVGNPKVTVGHRDRDGSFELLSDFLWGSAPLWHALPPMRIDSAFVRVLSDIRSDRRVFLTYDHQGRLVRTSELEAPIGLFEADLSTSSALALRSTERTEFVVYRWFWK